jgi:stage III sporulation protein AB
MILKIIGGLISIGAGTIIGLYFSCRTGFRIDELIELKRCLIMLKSEIEYSVSVLPEALDNISQKSSGRPSLIFKAAAEYMADGSETAYSAWNKAIRTEGRSRLNDEDIENIGAIGQTLGYMDKRLQLSSIDMSIDYIDLKRAELNGQSLRDKRLYTSLGVLAGAAVTIILF